MLTGIHFLLTYTCSFECDHCFLYCSPRAEGTFTLAQIRNVLDEAKKLGTVESIYFEGGEPFLYYPIMVEGLRLSRASGFEGGIVTNCYWATTVEDAAQWLGPVHEIGIDDLSLSDDAFHHGDEEETAAKRAVAAAAKLGIPAGSICIEKPTVEQAADRKGEPVVGGGALFKGRAVEKLTDGLPTRPVHTFTECPHEELVDPKRVHIDAFGNVQVCQGISIGNMWEKPLSELIEAHDAAAHPICGPLSRGGPAELARAHDVELDGEFVDECHHCYLVRRALIDKFPQYLAPRQVYGLEDETQ
jgi:MoaA/NifB/PqqE/SkfB family radical SAM enzyme